MKSKVFVSCGQSDDHERHLASSLAALLEREGFQPYVAIEVQTVFEINSRLLRHLKDSDCYLFVNLRRDGKDGRFKGSFFSHQEFAIAYAFGFENILVVNQVGASREGMLGCLASNTETFEDIHDCLPVVERAIHRAGWKCNYTRRLSAGKIRFEEKLIRYGHLVGNFLYLDINNHRPDIAALHATGRLSAYASSGAPLRPSEVRSPLKATGRPGYSHTIFPDSHEAFDLLCVGWWNPPIANEREVPPSGLAITTGVKSSPADFGPRKVYLNTALDVKPLPCLPITTGAWLLRFEFFAIDFPILAVTVELTIEASAPPTARVISVDSGTGQEPSQ